MKKREADKTAGPNVRADEVEPAGRDDLIPLGDSGEETIGRSAARTPRQVGLEVADEDEGL